MNAALILAFALPGGIAGLAMWLIIVAAIVAVVFIGTRAMGVTIPAWVNRFSGWLSSPQFASSPSNF